MFGTYDETAEIDEVVEAKSRIYRGLGKLAGLMAKAFSASGGSGAQDSPCPDARPGDIETPCAKAARELQAKAAAHKAKRRAR
jgi:hypothetical protein